MDAMPEVGTEEWARSKERPFTNRWNGKAHDAEYCCASVPDDGRSPTFHQCRRKPKIFYGSLGYCSTHDPVAAKARRDAKYAGWAAESSRKSALYEAEKKQREFERACADAIRQIADGHNDPRTLATDLLATLTQA